jgi:hypothetical protein
MHVFRNLNPINQATVTLTAPASLALRFLKDGNGIAVADDGQSIIAETRERRGEKVSWRWQVKDQAAIKQEDSLPPLSTFCPTLRITAGQWDTYAAKVLSALHDAARPDDTIGRRAGEITRTAKSPEERIAAIRDFVVRSIRAAGPGCDDLPLSAVTPAQRTLADGYGNTTDRAVVLYSLLKALDLNPEFVLVNYGSSMDLLKDFEAQYPAANAFGSVLVRVPNGSTPIYLNDTNQYAALGATAADGRLALPLAQGRTETIAAPQDKRNLREYELHLVLSEEGDARIRLTRRNYGEWFGSRHKLFVEMPPEERNRFYQEMVAEISQAAVADSDLVTDFTSYPGVESYSVRADRYAVRDGDHLYFELPRSLRGLFGLRSDTHESPFYQGGDETVRIVTTVELPAGFTHVVLSPGQEQWQLPSGGGTARVAVTTANGEADGAMRLVFTHEVDLDPFLLEADRYPDLVDIDKQLAHAQARTVLVTRRK